MPQINDYTPQTGAQGAVGAVTPQIDSATLFGRGIENVGASISQAADVVHRREAQEEISNVYGQFAQARADWTIKLKERLKDGSLDPDKFDQEYADYVNKAGENVKTAEGKNFFNRQANRLGGTLMQNAIIGKAQVAGEQAFAAISSGINMGVATLRVDPEQYDGVMDSTVELIAAKQKDGIISPEQAIRLKKELLPQLAESAIKGYADMEPGVGPDGEPYPNIAKQLLDEGAFSEHFNENQRSGLYNYIKSADAGKRSEKERIEADAHRQLQKAGLDYMDQNANRIMDGKYSIKELAAAPLTFEQKLYVKHQIDTMNRQESITDKPTFNRVYKQILAGEVTSREQLYQMVTSGKVQIAPRDMDYLEKKIDSTPDGIVIKNMQKGINQMIDKTFNIKGIGGTPIPAAQAMAADVRMEMLQAERTFIAGGGTVRQFYQNTNIKDPLSPYAILQRHQISMPEMMAMQAQQYTNQTTGVGDNTAVNKYSNSPTKEIPASVVVAPTEDLAPPQGKEPGMFDRMSDKKVPPLRDLFGLQESEAAIKRRKDKEDQWLADHPGKSRADIPQEIKPVTNKELSDQMIRPGESISAWKKRTGK